MLSRLGFVIKNSSKFLANKHYSILPPVSVAWSRSFKLRSFHTHIKLLKDEKVKLDGIKLGSFKVDKPMMMIAFTCKKCNTRSSHTMSKQAYTGGTVLITCPSCKARHLIADHLKIFRDDRVTIEDILNAKGESVSSTTDDLAFEDIPKNLQDVIGHHAKDAPAHLRNKLDNETIHTLPDSSPKKVD